MMECIVCAGPVATSKHFQSHIKDKFILKVAYVQDELMANQYAVNLWHKPCSWIVHLMPIRSYIHVYKHEQDFYTYLASTRAHDAGVE